MKVLEIILFILSIIGAAVCIAVIIKEYRGE